MKLELHLNRLRAALICVSLLADGSALPAATTNLIPIADTSLHEEEPNNNLGGGNSLTAGGRLQGFRTRALLRFDIAGNLPAGAVITAASLTVKVTLVNVNGANSTFALHPLLAAWTEGSGASAGSGTPAAAGETTWNNRLAPDTAWVTAGGDFAPTASATAAIAGVGSYTFSDAGLAADVQAWLDQPGTNFGWLLRSQDEDTTGTIRRFTSREELVAPPSLAVAYSTSLPPPTPPNLFDVSLVAGGLRFSFNSEAGHSYAVLFRDVLAGGDWDVLTNIPALTGNATLHITNAPGPLARYFRVRAQ